MEACTGRWSVRWMTVWNPCKIFTRPFSYNILTKPLLVLGVVVVVYSVLAWLTHKHVHRPSTEVKSSVHHAHFDNELSDDVTIVTAFFDVGELEQPRRSADNYSNWMMSFRYIKNPVVAIFDEDDEQSIRRFKQIRKSLKTITDIRKIDRKELWTFKIMPNVTEIFNQSGYPRHYPNTINPEYACISSSKFEITKLIINENPFKTRYFAWADIGYFRRRLTDPVHLYLPQDFNEEKVAFTELEKYDEHLSPVEIVTDNLRWVDSGYFTGHHAVINHFVTGYLKNLHYFVTRQIMAVDQQLIYAMYNRRVTRDHLPHIQTYSEQNSPAVDCPELFYLGCLCWRNPRNSL